MIFCDLAIMIIIIIIFIVYDNNDNYYITFIEFLSNWSYVVLFMCVAAAAAAKSLQLCLSLCDTRDGSPPGSPVPGILQARTLEWVAIAFSNA